MSISKALNSLGFWNEVDSQNEITDFKLENNGDGKGVVIVWLSDKTQPSDAAIKEADDALQAEYDSLAYSRSRANEYPKIEELVVALYDTDDKAAIEKRRSDVKAKYPKPE
tara:strand:+ start:170 stop:502 length:333 start_codon:yes stop_codon:yes gene_type:complete